MQNLEDFRFDQTKRLISVEYFHHGKNKIVVVAFEGVEELSSLSRFRLEVVSLGRPLAPNEMLGENLEIALRVRDEVRKINGIISRFEVLRTSVRDHHLHLIELVPPAWLMTLNQRYRIFPHDRASHEIVESVMGDNGVSFSSKSVGEELREYWVQYGESDFNLVARLLEEEGLFFRVDHSSAGCRLIVGDGAGDYTPGSMDLVAEENLLTWQPQFRIGASAFKHASWDYKQVSLVDSSVNGLAHAQPPGLAPRQVHEYPARHWSSDASRHAANRMAAEEATLAGAIGSCLDCRVEPGAKYKVVGHALTLPNGSEASASYAVTRVEHRARDYSQMPFEGDTSYINEFHCIPSDFDYRPPRITPRPLIQGPQTAIVTDTPDEQGRCKVKFHWDSEGVSRWARVAQVWAYNKMGTQFFPRIDSEVVVEFLDGDPDHPIIVGMVYNGKNEPLFKVPDNKTQSGWRGANWGDAGTPDVSNEIRFEDKAGSEEIYVHAQKDFRRVVHHDDNLEVETGNRTIKIDQGNLSETISQGNASYTLTQGNSKTQLDMGNHDLNLDAGAASTTAMQSITLTVGGSSVKVDQEGVTIKGMMIKIEGDITVDVKAPMTTVKGDGLLTLKGGLTLIN